MRWKTPPSDAGSQIPATRGRRRIALVGSLALGLIAFGLSTHAGLAALGAAVGPPTPRISSAPPRTTAARSATFAVDSVPDATLECSVDDSPFATCSRRVIACR